MNDEMKGEREQQEYIIFKESIPNRSYLSCCKCVDFNIIIDKMRKYTEFDFLKIYTLAAGFNKAVGHSLEILCTLDDCH